MAGPYLEASVRFRTWIEMVAMVWRVRQEGGVEGGRRVLHQLRRGVLLEGQEVVAWTRREGAGSQGQGSV